PYQVIAFNQWDAGLTAETAEVPDKHRYKWSLTIKNNNGTALAPTLTLSLPEIVLQRVTLSFKGLTTTDQTNLDTWKNDPNPSALLPCSQNIQVVPVIKVEAVDKLVGASAVNLCTTTNKLDVQLYLTDRTLQPVSSGSFGIDAANYHALQAYSFQASDRLLSERAQKLLSSVRSISNPNSNQEETEGEFLHLVGLKYMRYVSDALIRIGELDGGSGHSGNHIGLTSSKMKVGYLLDIPFAISRDGFLIDMPALWYGNVDITLGGYSWKSFRLWAYATSAYESYVWQENARMDAVSSVRGIQFANETGIQVLKIPDRNSWLAQKSLLTSNANSSLNYSIADVNFLEATYFCTTSSVCSGYTLTLPRSLIQYGGWKGWIIIAEDSVDFTWSFLISGQSAGGFTVDDPIPIDLVFEIVSPPVPGSATAPSTFSSAIGPGLTQFDTFNGDPVNMVNGNMYHTERDLVIKGRGGLPLVFERSYNSREAKDGPLGFGWTHSFNHFLKFSDDNANFARDADDTDGITSSVIWTDGTGSEKFVQIAGNSTGVPIGSVFTPPQGFFFQTTRNADGTYTIREKNGLAYTFENVAGTVNQTAKLVSIKDRNNNTLTLNYTGSQLTAVTDGLNRSLTFTYSNNRISQICDWTNRCHRYVYDIVGNLSSYKNPLAVAGTQNPVSYEYYSDSSNPNVNHAMKKYTLPRGNSMTFEYYINGKAFRHYNTLGETSTFTYNEFRRETVSTNERGHQRQFFFDKFGNPTKIIEERGGQRIYAYDTANPMNRISKRDPMGYVTQYVYDANGNVTTVTNTSGSTVLYSHFDTFNQPGKVKDARGNYTIFKYDAKGNVLQVIKPRNGIGATIEPVTYTPVPADLVAWTINTYDGFGNLLTSKQVRDFATQVGPTMEFTYDSNNLNATTITRRGDKDGNGTIDAPDSVALVYDSLGRATTGLRPDWHLTQATFDSVDRVTQGTDPLGNTRTYGFDANGNLSNSSLSFGAFSDQTSYAYDLSDRRIGSTNSGGFTTSRQYDAAGNVIQITDPDGRSLRFDYDPNNKVIASFDEEGRSVVRSLDLDGKPRSITDANGNTIQ
ncbi:MAG: RHS repeat protein, partial [Ignavibacteriae bacterium]|nr:RHS repeat protein [Ignavibacteriota bacterium]